MTRLSNDVDAFIAYAANDPDLDLTQSDLGRITGRDQSTVSRLKKQIRKGPEKEALSA